MKYAVLIERTNKEVERMIREAIQFHVEGLKQDGLPIPPPLTLCEYVDASL